MQKLKTFLRRVRTMSFKRMLMYAKLCREDSKKPLVFILVDMLWCTFRYGVGYFDYRTFGFVHQNAAARRTYMTMNDNIRLVHRLNDAADKMLFEDKIKFLETFPEYAKRGWLDLRAQTPEDLRAFAQKDGSFFAKESGNYGGFGVERIHVSADTDYKALYDTLVEEKQYLAEQGVVQHSMMNKLNPTSVNTIRVVTLLKDGKAHFMYALVRMGSGSGCVDNISSGGMYAPVSREGVITAPAFCDKTGEYYDCHPVTETPFVGFAIPMFDEAIEMVESAAPRVPSVRYVGWDVAISKDGPLFIEGNSLPSYDMCQNYRHLGADKIGVRPRFIEVLGDEFYK